MRLIDVFRCIKLQHREKFQKLYFARKPSLMSFKLCSALHQGMNDFMLMQQPICHR
jgi:hypothetical protein